MDRATPLIVITGPTCSGKTGLAFKISEEFPVEVISADSMQVYRHMDIATAKPDRSAQELLKHHLIDICDPDQEFNAGMFARLAAEAIAAIRAMGKIPLVVGGTGLYIKALLYGLGPLPAGSTKIRSGLDLMVARRGSADLHRILARLDPMAAGKINPGDPVRITRALEVIFQSGRRISDLHAEHSFAHQRHTAMVMALSPERQQLYAAIDRRVDQMVAAGLIAETEQLLDMGYGLELNPMNTLAYKHIVGHLKGAKDLDQAVALIKRDTRHYAKRQLTWLNKHRPDAVFTDSTSALKQIRTWLKTDADGR